MIDIEVDRGTGALSAASLIAVGPGAAVVPLVARVVERVALVPRHRDEATMGNRSPPWIFRVATFDFTLGPGSPFSFLGNMVPFFGSRFFSGMAILFSGKFSWETRPADRFRLIWSYFFDIFSGGYCGP